MVLRSNLSDDARRVASSSGAAADTGPARLRRPLARSTMIAAPLRAVCALGLTSTDSTALLSATRHVSHARRMDDIPRCPDLRHPPEPRQAVVHRELQHRRRGARTSAPDLVVNTGDMALDGVAEEHDLAEARRLHDAIGLPERFVPGNHDLGESHDVPDSKETPISMASRQRYLSHFGDDYWQFDVPGWRLIGVNSQLLASNLGPAAVEAGRGRERPRSSIPVDADGRGAPR